MHFILKAYFYIIEIYFFKQIILLLCIKLTKISKNKIFKFTSEKQCNFILFIIIKIWTSNCLLINTNNNRYLILAFT